jgi:hypothetical protein
MSGYTPPPDVYLYQGSGNLFPAIGSRSSTRVTENFVTASRSSAGFRTLSFSVPTLASP